MSSNEDNFIHWNDNGKVKDILEEHIVHVKTETSRGAVKLFREAANNLLHTDHIDWFITHLFSIVGMEMEGREVSIGFLYFKDKIPEHVKKKFRLAKLGKWVSSDLNKELHFGQQGFTQYRRIVRVVRSELIGWVPGNFLEPVIILTGEAEPRINDIRILLAKRRITALTAHELYSELTKNCQSLAIWIKPAGSIRLYRAGHLIGQIMRLRDVGGWTSRNIQRVVETVCQVSSSVGIRISEKTCRKWIIEPSISMSESRRGCTIVIMNKSTFEDLEAKWKNDGETVACKAKHAPKREELRSHATEAEYENYLMQDGAVVLSPKGNLQGMGTYFKGGPGGRKDTASWLPMVVDKCITIVTSQDGPIYLYWSIWENKTKKAKGLRLDFMPTKDARAIEVEPKQA